MNPSPSRRASTDNDGRDRILGAAVRQFAREGYEGTTTAAVAREAGVTQPLVHHHFGSKEGLWRAAMDQLFSEAQMFTAIDREKPLLEAIMTAAAGLVRIAAARPELIRIVARVGTTDGPHLQYLVDRYLRAQFQEVVDAIHDAQAAGLLDPSLRPDLLLFFVTGACGHLFEVSALARGGLGIDTTSEKTREQFVSLVLSVLESGIVRKGSSK